MGVVFNVTTAIGEVQLVHPLTIVDKLVHRTAVEGTTRDY